jgi:Adenylate and Guanylate cyclase catalytic domain
MDAERRQVTVLFTDMVGFTTFSERSGEEAAYTLMQSLSKLMGDCVREQGGAVQTFTGDGIMAVFGAPIAFEDAPLRACRAALAILQRLKEDGPDLEAKHGIRPQMRIGLNSAPPLCRRANCDFLIERDLLRTKGGKLEFDPGAVAVDLPASVQSILDARVNRLSPKDRALLQAAVIGRRFDAN